MADHSLILGSLTLTDSIPHASDGYVFNVLAEGAGFGVAQGLREVVTSLLADGDLTRVTRYGNREVSFQVEITGPSLSSLAEGEAALRNELGKGNTLTWQAPDLLAAPTVFEVVTSQMEQKFNDLDELRTSRTFVVTLTCGPFARSAQATTITALAPPPVTPITASVTTADTTTGFTAYATGMNPNSVLTGRFAGSVPVTDQGNYVQSQFTAGQPRLTITYSTGSPVSTATTPFLVLELSGDFPDNLYINGGRVAPALTRATSNGTTIYVLYTGEVAVSTIGVSCGIEAYTRQQPTLTLNVHDIYRTNTMPQITARETAAVIDIGGTERTPCSLQVNPAAGELLGIGIVHTSPEAGIGYSPALRQRRYAGNAITTNPALVSGASEPVNTTPVTATIPTLSLPEDGYSLVALMKSSVAGTFPITYNVKTALAGSFLTGGDIRTTQATFATAGSWTLVSLGNLVLPPIRASQNATVVIDLTRTPVGAEVIDLDEWWVFRMGDGCALTMVQSPKSYLWLDSPDVNSPVPHVWVGNNADRSDAHHPAFWLINQGNHVLHPGGTSVFVASGGIANPSVTATAYRRWHSNAAS